MSERSDGSSKVISDEVFEKWVAENPPPSLNELIQTYGSYLDIPIDAWIQWDADVWEWQQRRKDRLYRR